MNATYVEWMGIWFVVMVSHLHIIFDVLVFPKLIYQKEHGIVQSVLWRKLIQGSRASKSLSGAEIFGIDPYGRVFFGTCGYLLV